MTTTDAQIRAFAETTTDRLLRELAADALNESLTPATRAVARRLVSKHITKAAS